MTNNKAFSNGSAPRGFSRRDFLGQILAGVPLVGILLSHAPRARAAAGPAGLVIREKVPLNLEMPFSSLDDFIVPNDRFYVRCHFAIPEIKVAEWRLKVEGAVERPLELSYEELLRMGSTTLPALLECAGNGRVYLDPKVTGAQWALGAVGTAEWTGVPLKAVLERAGIKDSAMDIILEGVDSGPVSATPRPAGALHYARSVPREKALKDVLLAYQMNRSELPPAHGFPVRAIVPGWYGMASVKWLHRIVVTERPFQGFFQTVDYAYWDTQGPLPTLIPLTELQVKSAIARPSSHEVIPAGSRYRVHGAAWTADSTIRKVEVTTDGGATWKAAKLLGEPVRNAWQLWEFEWQAPSKPGMYTLKSRATDGRGRTQPEQHNPNYGKYMIHHTLPVEVMVS